MNYSEDDNPLGVKSDFILSLCELIMGSRDGIEAEEKSVIDRCLPLVYQNYFSDPKPENMPILGDLYDCLRKQKEPQAQRIATALEIYVNGSLKVFNHQTNVELNNRIVCFDIKELGKQLKKLGMLIIQDQVWKRNVYWDCYNGIRSASVTGREDEIVDSFEEVEQLFYKIHYQEYVEGQNARNWKNHHPERNRTTDDIRTHKKTCPEETIYQIGTKDDYVDPDVLLTIVTEFITELSDRFGEHFHLLNWSLHLDESTPHIHERHVFDCKNAYGEIFPQQEKALETLGFDLPNPEKKAGRFNNRKMVFDATCRILLFDICKKHGLELEEEPSYGGREYLEKQDYIRMKQKKDIASLEESIQSQIEAVNQKKYEIFEQEVQYKENSIKIIDQEKKLKAQSVEFFDNAERILQQDETLKQLEFKIEDVEKLIDDVTDEVYEKAVERIADEIEIATRKEDIKLVEDSKKWVLSPERKASKREKQYALDRLDGVIKKIEYAITKTISKMKNRLLKPENKNIMVQEIKKEVKPSILKKLSEKKASITRNGETGKLNKES